MADLSIATGSIRTPTANALTSRMGRRWNAYLRLRRTRRKSRLAHLLGEADDRIFLDLGLDPRARSRQRWLARLLQL